MQKINWAQRITVLANIGVLRGIVFLAIEIRDSRIATLAQTQDSVTDGFLSLNLATIQNPEIGLTFQKGLCDPEGLSDLEATRFSMQLRAFLISFVAYTGYMNKDFWMNRLGICMERRPTNS